MLISKCFVFKFWILTVHFVKSHGAPEHDVHVHLSFKLRLHIVARDEARQVGSALYQVHKVPAHVFRERIV